jgi:serine protease Do
MARLKFLPLFLLLCQNGLAYTAAELYKKVIPSIVTVITFDIDGKTVLCSGTGFFLHSDMLVTNKHVVLNTEHLDAKPEKKGYWYTAITYDGKQLPMTQDVYEDADYDLALVFFRGVNMPKTGDLDYNPELGLHVLVIGSPRGKILAGTLSQDFINAPLKDEDRLIQTDVPFTNGNSGSPMFNDNGGIVGVADAIIEQTTISFAIPAHCLSTALNTHQTSVGPEPKEKTEEPKNLQILIIFR